MVAVDLKMYFGEMDFIIPGSNNNSHLSILQMIFLRCFSEEVPHLAHNLMISMEGISFNKIPCKE